MCLRPSAVTAAIAQEYVGTLYIFLLSLARFISRKFTPLHAAIIRQTNTLHVQRWHEAQPALACLQTFYCPQRKLRYRKLLYLLQNPLPAQQSKNLSLSAGVY